MDAMGLAWSYSSFLKPSFRGTPEVILQITFFVLKVLVMVCFIAYVKEIILGL